MSFKPVDFRSFFILLFECRIMLVLFMTIQRILECRIIEIFYIKSFCELINSETFYKSPENCMRNGKFVRDTENMLENLQKYMLQLLYIILLHNYSYCIRPNFSLM